MDLGRLSVEEAFGEVDDHARSTSPAITNRARGKELPTLVNDVELVAESDRVVVGHGEFTPDSSVEDLPARFGIQSLPVDPGVLFEPLGVEGPLDAGFIWSREGERLAL